jgi:dienelactone hydrolase
MRSDPAQEYLVYVPKSGGANARILASVHGISRNAAEQARSFAPFCDEAGVVMVVPKFVPEHHRDYQRLGRQGSGARADRALERCLWEVASLTGAEASQVYLFGYSGGAQFVHRYLMAHPHRVARAVIAAAGWYTFPDNQRRYPYGTRPVRSLPNVRFNPEEFLHIPVDVLVGELDTTSPNLRSNERLDEQQGRTRLERARNWVAAMQEAARTYGIDSKVSFTAVPHVDHSFNTFCQRGALIERVTRALFAETAKPPSTELRSAASKGNGSKPVPALPGGFGGAQTDATVS